MKNYTYEKLVDDVNWFMEHKNDTDQCAWFRKLKKIYPDIPDRALIGYWYQLSANVFAGCLGIPTKGYRQYVKSHMERILSAPNYYVQ